MHKSKRTGEAPIILIYIRITHLANVRIFTERFLHVQTNSMRHHRCPFIASANNTAVTGRYGVYRLSKLLKCRVRGHDIRDNIFDIDYRVKTNTWFACTNKLLVFYWSPLAAVRISTTELASALPANHREDIK